MRGEQHCFHGFNPGDSNQYPCPTPAIHNRTSRRRLPARTEHFHDTKTTYHVIADSRPHATLTISLLSECHCNVIRFTDITPIEDIESGTDHPTDLDADPKQVNAYQIFREASFQITIPATGTGRISPLPTHSPKPETSTTITRPKTPPGNALGINRHIRRSNHARQRSRLPRSLPGHRIGLPRRNIP